MAPSAIAPENVSTEQDGPVSLDIRLQGSRPEFYQAMAKIMKLREVYIKKRVIFVKGEEMAAILRGLGAQEADFASLIRSGDLLKGDPTLPYRKTSNARYCMDFEGKTMRRLEQQRFILSKDENFKRYDSDTYRDFDEAHPKVTGNTVFQALMVFKSCILNGVSVDPRPSQDYDSKQWITTAFQVRTTTTQDILGEPALEGVHSDGVDHTMVTMLEHHNMTADSAITLVHDMREQVGQAIQNTAGSLVRGVVQHWDFLDTLVLVDNERFHSLTPVEQADTSRDAVRDVLIWFTRRPAVKGHASETVDSTKPHLTQAVNVPLFVPAV